jgi:hypothetical protein
MAYYFECDTRNIWDGKEVVESVDMDIFLEFLQDYHEEKWEKNSWDQIQMRCWVEEAPDTWGNINYRRKCARAYKRYVENAFHQCFFSGKNYDISQKRPMYKAYSYFIKANYNQ